MKKSKFSILNFEMNLFFNDDSSIGISELFIRSYIDSNFFYMIEMKFKDSKIIDKIIKLAHYEDYLIDFDQSDSDIQNYIKSILDRSIFNLVKNDLFLYDIDSENLIIRFSKDQF